MKQLLIAFIFRYTFHYFTNQKRAPFRHDEESDITPKKKLKRSSDTTDLEIVECCLNFLQSDLNFFRRIWNWDEFIEIYWNRGCDLQKYYTNQILSLLFGMKQSQLNVLNKSIPKSIEIQKSIHNFVSCEVEESVPEKTENQLIEWNFKSDTITSVEDIFLMIYDKQNYNFYQQNRERLDNLVQVDSTKINLRSLALGVSSGKAICLSGPVGSGKTSLVEYLARKTGRMAPKIADFQNYLQDKLNSNVVLDKTTKKNKRKIEAAELNGSMENLRKEIEKITPKNGFLRIQLGDQTDSKVLLGQYR